MAHAKDRPPLITDAEPGRDEQLRIRQIRYGVMMGIRALLLVVAFVLVSLEVPLLWLWLSICAVGMVVLPWTAVLVANDRLPKEEHRISRWFSRSRPAADDTRRLTARKSRVIDVDS